MTATETPATLAEALPRYDSPYLLTVSDAASPHTVAVTARLDGDRMRVTGHGRRSTAFAQQRPAVTVLWPAPQPGGHALIVDGTAAVDGDALLLSVTRAVLHRGGDAVPAADQCVSNCVELGFPRP